MYTYTRDGVTGNVLRKNPLFVESDSYLIGGGSLSPFIYSFYPLYYMYTSHNLRLTLSGSVNKKFC